MDELLIGKRVSVVTVDGQHVVGTLTGQDHLMNLCFADATAISYFPKGSDAAGEDAAPEETPLGGFVIRGDDVACVGQVDTVAEAALDLAASRFDGFTGQSAATA